MKKLLIIAAICVLAGILIFACVMTALKWDFSKLSSATYDTATYTFADGCSAISIATETADIRFTLASDGVLSVTCYEDIEERHAVSVKDGVLTVELADAKKWYQHIGFGFEAPIITVALPAGEYGALTVRSDTGKVEIPKDFTFASIDIEQTTGSVLLGASASGDIRVETTTGRIWVAENRANSVTLSASTGSVLVGHARLAGDLSVDVTTGKVVLSDVTCQNLISDGSTGSIALSDVIASGKMTVERTTGDVEFERSDAAELSITVTTGDVEGSLLSDKVFIVETTTGDRDVSYSTTGGRCEITTTTGDIEITVEKG